MDQGNFNWIHSGDVYKRQGKGLTQRGTRLLLNKEYDKLNYGNSKKTKYIRAWNRVEALYTSHIYADMDEKFLCDEDEEFVFFA